MAIATFFDASLSVQSQQLRLDQTEARHAFAARRLTAGSQVRILNGQGVIATAEILRLDKRNFEASIKEVKSFPRPTRRVLVATAIPKVERQRFMIESLTQLGVGVIIPLLSERSAQRNHGKNLTKWARYSVEAVKQSINPWLPEIQEPQDLDAVFAITDSNMHWAKWLATPEVSDSREDGMKSRDDSDHIVLVGPEGGFTAEELADIKAHSFEGLRLSEHILRTETAAISAAVHLASTL